MDAIRQSWEEDAGLLPWVDVTVSKQEQSQVAQPVVRPIVSWECSRANRLLGTEVTQEEQGE